MYEYSKRPSKFKYFFIMFLVVVLTSAASVYVYSIYAKIEVQDYGEGEEKVATRLYSDAVAEEVDYNDMLKNVSRSVVGISKVKNTGTAIFDMDGTKALGIGSGIIVSENGYIATNWHVAGDKYSNCYITLENGNITTGNVVWADSDLDLAIVKIGAKGLKYVELGDSDNIKLGETVFAIGNPIGIEFQRTVTAGIISGLNRTVKIKDEETESYMEDLIQTDASINSGNSGGPLINKQGQVIGVNSIKISSAEGIGFAIPINIVKPIIENFAKNEKFEEAYLGIFAYDTEVNKYLNSNLNFDSGIYVAQISADGPAKKTALKVGDIITKIDETEINKMSELRSYIYGKAPGDEVSLTINRNNKEYNVKITLGKRT